MKPVLVAGADGTGTGLVLFPRADALPAAWAGRVTPGLDPGDVAPLLAAARPCPLLPQHGEGWFGRPGKRHRARAMEALEQTGMVDLAKRQIGELSGGQQQRTFLARALAQDAEIYLMDEPFAGVDAATERTIVHLLGRMRDAGKTVIVVHHDLQTAARYFDRLLLLNMRVVAHGPTAEVFLPEILEKTYGGKLTLLSEIAARAHQGEGGQK